MFNPQDNQQPLWNRAARDQDEPLFYTKTQHPLLFSCQCRRCVRMHTISMQDREFLSSIGVVWQTGAAR